MSDSEVLTADAAAAAGAAEAGKFRQDVVWNLASLAVMALSGFWMLAAIDASYDQVALGVFGQVWGIYIIVSQLAVGGLDRSVLRALSSEHDPRRQGPLALGGILPAVGLSALFALAFWAIGRQLAVHFLESDAVAQGIAAAAPGLFCFGVNKVLLSTVNGLRRMRAFAVYQSIRYLGMPIGVYAAVALGMPGSRAAFLFTFAEALLLVVLCAEVWLVLPRPFTGWRREVSEHLRYGVRGVFSGVLLELNTRVDVLMLGYFLTEEAPIGLYVVALQVAEGLYQIVVVLQHNYNPLLARHLAARRHSEVEALVRRGRWLGWGLMVAAAAIAWFGYPLAVRELMQGTHYDASAAPFAWLLIGIAVSAGYLPFQQLLLMGNHPGWHSGYMALTVLVNVIGNAILIPSLGITGAAIATAISFAASVLFLKVMARRLLSVRI